MNLAALPSVIVKILFPAIPPVESPAFFPSSEGREFAVPGSNKPARAWPRLSFAPHRRCQHESLQATQISSRDPDRTRHSIFMALGVMATLGGQLRP
jgi:hypothetical protein